MEKAIISTDEQLRICSSQIDQLQLENARVVKQLKEVMKMNTHWQRYDSQREEYVLKLTKINQELQDKVSDLQRRIEDLGISEETESKREKPKEGKGQHAVDICKGDENERDDLEALRKEEVVAELTDRIAKLKERIVELEKGRESRKKQDDDQLALLREQVNVCVEDFKQERKDRERIHGENEKLRERLALAEKQIRVYKNRATQLQQFHHPHTVSKPPPRNGYDVPCCYPEDRPGRPHRYSVPVVQYHQNGYRHPMYFGDDLTDLPRDVEVDGVSDELQEDQTDGVPIINGSTDPSEDISAEETEDAKEAIGEEEEEPLQCPRCLASFELGNHADLLKHIDKCID